MIRKVQKRDRRIVDFDPAKIAAAIGKAAQAEGEPASLGTELTPRVVARLEARFPAGELPTVEDVQDAVEQALIGSGHDRVAKAYIIYRQRRAELRAAKLIVVGVRDELKLTLNATKVLERRYLLKNERGEVTETPAELFRRVACLVAGADAAYDAHADLAAVETEFYELMTSFDFLPNSPTLMNAGTRLGQLAACFVLPVEDTMEGIFEAVKDAALIHQTGGGTGFAFSRLRPRNDVVQSTGGIASGPLSFMRVFDVATDVIKQGGRRRGANMGILRIDHPDIMEFITAKVREGTFTNFNISVGVTDQFMAALAADDYYPLVNPHTGRTAGRLQARAVFSLIATMAWLTGDPGIVFLDRINRANPTPARGAIEATNPCGEQPLLPYEACNLGSVNLGHLVRDGTIDYARFGRRIDQAIHFLDNVIDVGRYPLDRVTEIVRANRKIGLGVMGFADLLVQLGLPYDSDDALRVAEEVMTFLAERARAASAELARRRGSFPNHPCSIFAGGAPRRNATLTTVAPTGTLSIIAGCSSGIEPLFAIVYVRSVMEGTDLFEVNRYFEAEARMRGFYSDRLMKEIARTGSVQRAPGVPDDVRRRYVTALEVAPEWHVRVQAAFQRHTDNAVSKTVNLPATATPAAVEEVYRLAWELGVKGVTVFRQGSRQEQVLHPGVAAGGRFVTFESEYAGGCAVCKT